MTRSHCHSQAEVYQAGPSTRLLCRQIVNVFERPGVENVSSGTVIAELEFGTYAGSLDALN